MDYDDILNEAIAREARARFYEAAEGEQYFRETAAREHNYRRLRELQGLLATLQGARS